MLTARRADTLNAAGPTNTFDTTWGIIGRHWSPVPSLGPDRTRPLSRHVTALSPPRYGLAIVCSSPFVRSRLCTTLVDTYVTWVDDIVSERFRVVPTSFVL